MPLTSQEHAGFISGLIQSSKDELNVAIPCTVIAVNGDRVDIQPEINRGPMLKDRTRDYKQTEIIYNIPVVNIGCAGLNITFPISEGCSGLYIHCDYDIDNWLLGDPNPHTARTHDLNDGFFIPAFNGGVNDGDCIELGGGETTLYLCPNGFDVVKNGVSLIDTIAACCPPVAFFKP